MPQTSPHVAVIGAGIGGLATALRLAHHGIRTTVLERHSAPGGKMRQVATPAGPVDAGPTVLTLKPVFEALFADVGLQLEDVVTFHRQDLLGRHFWHDGTTLDLMHDPQSSFDNVQAAFGSKSAREFSAFSAKARHLFETFDAPMMQTPAPSLAAVARVVASEPRVISAMDPLRKLAASLNRQFSEPRLAQLFARYATYVGGLATATPALLGLIWHAESQGVWHVDGGMHQLARGIAGAAALKGAEFHYDTHVTRIETQGGAICAVQTEDRRFQVDAVVFNGDPNALTTGALGPACISAVSPSAVTPRSLSAHVMSFAATPAGPPLAAHNVFFAKDPKSEYAPLSKGQNQTDPTLYICAQDRFGRDPPSGPERFEIILNSPPLGENIPSQEVKQQCQTRILSQLRDHGLTFSPAPDVTTMTGPQDFDQMFPASKGSLYGRSPHGMMAAFQRPTARTAMKGLYLTGGGAHPGAGVPMAVLSARHAAAAILNDLPST
ncbi:MAG: 1-hydroxycarotenoid 3,4-desaturase CrtD [Paracoccaceae bacterium]